MDEFKAMEVEEIESFLVEAQKGLTALKTGDRLFELYMELTMVKSELHRLVHFCVDDYERKQFFSMIDQASSLQQLTDKHIEGYFQIKRDNLKYDFEVEKKYMEQELERNYDQAVLFREFSKKLLSKKQYSRINSLALHCQSLNMKVGEYLRENTMPES